MALSMKLKKGEIVYIGDRALIIDDVPTLTTARVRTEDGKYHDLFDDRSVEVYPDVRVSVGLLSQEGLANLSFEAPREIVILREELYLRGKGAVQA